MKISNNVLSAAVVALGIGIAGSAKATDEVFNVTMSLVAPIVITETQALSFSNAGAGSASTVVTAPTDGTAAIFTATGEASTAVTGSVVEASIEMTTGDGVGTTKRITVDTFTTGGDMDVAGSATFDGAGDLTNLRIGATANVQAEDIAGAYTGTATFRLVYQ